MAKQSDSGISSAPFAGGEPLSIKLYQEETRSFPQIFSEWLQSEEEGGISNLEEAFLTKTNLKKFLSSHDVRAIELGEKIPGPMLTRIMAMHLPGGVFRRDELPLASIPQLYGFQNTAQRWRNLRKNSLTPAIDVSDEAVETFRLDVLKTLLQKAKSISVEDHSLPKESDIPPGIGEHIFDYFSHQGNIPQDIFEERLTAQYKNAPLQTLHSLHAILQKSDYEYTSKQLKNWLETLTSPKKILPVAEALCFLRQCKGMTQKTLAHIIGIDEESLRRREIGYFLIPRNKIDALVAALELNKEEKNYFTEIIVVSIEAKRQQKLLPLDPDFLSVQPKEKQAGLLLGAYRDRQNIQQYALADMIGVKRPRIAKLEAGFQSISPEKVDIFARVLNLSEEERLHFLKIAALSREARKMRDAKTTLGKTVHAHEPVEFLPQTEAKKGRS